MPSSPREEREKLHMPPANCFSPEPYTDVRPTQLLQLLYSIVKAHTGMLCGIFFYCIPQMLYCKPREATVSRCWRKEMLLWPKFYPRLRRAAVTAPTLLPLSHQSFYQPPNTKVVSSTSSSISHEAHWLRNTEWLTATLTDRMNLLAGCVWTKTPKSRENIS